MRLLHDIHAMADHCDVVTGGDCEADRFLEAIVIENGAHVEVVSHNQTPESELPAQEIRDDLRRKGRRSVTLLNRGIKRMADHEGVDSLRERAKHSEFVRLEVFARNGYSWQFVMRVARTTRIAGKMFAAGKDARALQGIIEGPCIVDHLRWIISVAAAAQGIVRVVVEGDIEHGAEIEIEPEHAQEPSGNITMLSNEREVSAITELIRIGRLVADEFQAGDTSTFLVDRDNRLDVTDVPKIVDQLA